MKALDKLRKLTQDIEPDSDPILWDILRAGVEQSWDCKKDDGKTLTGVLRGIAGQIEREQGEHAGPYDYRLVRMTWAVRLVTRDMERHVLGHEGMDDSPVARWARELRDALGGDAEADEDREAAAWVREHGGIECLEEVESMGDLMCRVCGVIGVHNWEYVDRGDFEKSALGELKKRLMPEGMEWPRYEDGEPVRFEDELPDFARTIYKTVKSIRFNSSGYVVIDNEGGSANVSVILKSGQRVKRPAPAVLAADGEPLEVGQTVYSLSDDRPYKVKSIEGDHVYINAGGAALDVWYFPCALTHHRPVLDADGVPIHDGDKVWVVENGHGPRIVKEMHGPSCVHLLGISAAYRADQLTHTKPELPDSWECVEEDAKKDRCSYFGAKYQDCGRCTQLATSCSISKARDLVRRCRALAERGQ